MCDLCRIVVADLFVGGYSVNRIRYVGIRFGLKRSTQAVI